MVRTVAAGSRRQRADDERLFATYAEVRADLVRALTLFLGSAEDALDVAQETFLKCWRTRGQVGTIRNLRAWIFRVGLNSARDLLRNHWRRRTLPLGDGSPFCTSEAHSPAEETLDREALDRVRSALQYLRPDERAVFLLRQSSPLTYEQIARVRRVPVGTIKTQMRAALTKLRGVLHGR
jgi:RNA polymerase sigma-70 factor (ECF subfamily)